MRRLLGFAVICVCLAPCAAIAWRYREMPHLGLHDDDGIYAVTARSLALGHGYRLEHLPGSPPQTKYPPLYPALLALLWRGGMPVLMAAQVALVGLFAALSWVWWRRMKFSTAACAVMAGLLLLNPTSAVLAVHLMSEPLFACLLMACMLTTRRPALCGALAGLAYLTRTAALPLFGAVPLFYWLRENRRGALLFLVCLTPFALGWQIWCRAHAVQVLDPAALYYTDYLAVWLADMTPANLPRIVGSNLHSLFVAVSANLNFSAVDTNITGLVFRLFGFAALAGAVRLLRDNGPEPLAYYAVGLMALLAFWNFQEVRFVWPLLPLLLAGAAEEVRKIWELMVQGYNDGRRAPAVAGTLLVAGFFLAACASNVDTLVRTVPALLESQKNTEEGQRAAAVWLQSNVGPQARVASWNGAKVYLETGLTGYTPHAPAPLFYNRDRTGLSEYFRRLPEFCRENRLPYILLAPRDFLGGGAHLTPDEGTEVRASLAARPDLTLLYSNRGNLVYQVQPR